MSYTNRKYDPNVGKQKNPYRHADAGIKNAATRNTETEKKLRGKVLKQRPGTGRQR